MVNRGFTLIELLIVISVLAILLSITLIAINPLEQFQKTRDVSTKNITTDFIKASVGYYASNQILPWNKNQDCNDELSAGGTLADMPNCLHELTGGGKLEESYQAQEELSRIHVTKCGESAILCYKPSSKTEIENATFTKFGVNNPGCPGTSSDSDGCYWCKPVIDNAACHITPTPTTPNPSDTPSSTPTDTPTATNTPTPTSTPSPTPTNPWGQAAVFDGKVAGRNPPSYTPILEFMQTPYNTKMDLTSANVTIEAWIKPDLPYAGGYDYRVMDHAYKLTLMPSWNPGQYTGDRVSYRYLFDVLAPSSVGCQRVPVYSSSLNWYPIWYPIPPSQTLTRTVPNAEFIQWKHVAGVMENGNLHVYENGIKLNSYNPGITPCVATGRKLLVGGGDNGSLAQPWYYNFFQGAIDEVRISNNVRYTSNFTPPTLPFTTDANTTILYHFDGNTSDSSGNSLGGSLVGDIYYTNSDIGN